MRKAKRFSKKMMAAGTVPMFTRSILLSLVATSFLFGTTSQAQVSVGGQYLTLRQAAFQNFVDGIKQCVSLATYGTEKDFHFCKNGVYKSLADLTLNAVRTATRDAGNPNSVAAKLRLRFAENAAKLKPLWKSKDGNMIIAGKGEGACIGWINGMSSDLVMRVLDDNFLGTGLFEARVNVGANEYQKKNITGVARYSDEKEFRKMLTSPDADGSLSVSFTSPTSKSGYKFQITSLILQDPLSDSLKSLRADEFDFQEFPEFSKRFKELNCAAAFREATKKQ